jgi:hypothetical protein
MRLRDRQHRRNRRLNTFRPFSEGLEPRIALSGDMIGVNLDSNSAYADNPIWTDLRNLSVGWHLSNSTAVTDLTADGYPLVNAQTSFIAANYPAGNYEFSFTGSGTVTFDAAGQLVGSVTVSDGVTSGTVAVNPSVSGGWVQMVVTNVNASDPMDNFHLMMPGYGNGTTPEPMFTPAFLQALEPFSDIRFMNWEAVNDSTLSTWANRVQPNAFLTDGPGGVPYEDMIELANEAQKDMWINIPAEATPQFVQSLAQLIYTDLDPNLNVYVEYGNEDWNGAFSAYYQIAAAAKANPILNQSLGQYQLVAQQSAYELVTDGQTFDQVFGTAGAARVRPIFGAQAVYDLFESYGLQFIQQEFGTPSQYISAIAEAPYVGIQSSQNVSGLTLNQLFADLNEYLTDTMVPSLTADASVAKQYNVPMVAYEGGQGLVPGANDLNFSVMQAAQYDPRMYQLYVAMMQDWEQAGGGLFNAYQLTGTGSQYGFWGMLPNVTVAGSQKYDALLSVMYPPGDANTDGTVDYADFQALQANYGSTDAYWKQGDFNDDGWVTWADLNILRQNLDPAGFTLSQFAQQALFGQLATITSPMAIEYDGYGVTYASSLPLTSTSGTVNLNENSAGQSIDLGGADYTEGLGFAGNSSTTIALNGKYSEFDSTIGVDSSGSTASSVIFELYNGTQLLYQSPVMGYGSAPVPISVDVAGVQSLTLVVEAAPGSTVADDHAVWGDARLISTANFGSTQPYTLTWQLSQNGQVLTTQTADSFAFAALSGTYTISLTVTDAAGATATASTSITEQAPDTSAALILKDSVTGGNWVGTYGSQGYDIAGDPAKLPSSALITVTGATPYTAAASTTNAGALLNTDDFGHAATEWYGSSFTIDVNLIDNQQHLLTIYADDWGNAGRIEQVQVSNAATGQVLDIETLSSFSGGVYLQWIASGNVQIKVTDFTGPNAVISGLFLDPVPSSTSPLAQRDGVTKGNWIGTYGSQGYDIEGKASDLPSYATVTVTGATSYTMAASTTDVRALENPSGSGRSATEWYGSSFTIDVNLTDSQQHLLTIYAVDWADWGRIEQIELIDPATGDVLDTDTLSSFSGGAYLQWIVSGNVEINVTNISGPNAVISGVFLDAMPPTENTVTQGNWIGTYGSQGYDIEGDAAALPSSATVTFTGATPYTMAASTTDVRALENPSGSGRTATEWYGSSFTIDVNLTDSEEHLLTIYAVDWAYWGRIEQIQLTNAATGQILDTQTLSSFESGVYLQWTVSGNVQIKVTNISGPNAVISGIFINPVGATSDSLVQTDSTTKGNWIGTYGSQGYDIEGDLPSDSSVTVTGATPYTMAASTTDVRALENPSGSGRTATEWYGSSFTIDVNHTGSQQYLLSIYAVDWADWGRVEQIQLIDPATGVVLDTDTLSSFSGGVYLQWNVSGSVQIRVTNITGPNAVVSGVFLD